ncbi:MAG TPA: CPBP family intramembrane glutamic endopeptidase [Acidobacteriaceae bacterium]
MPYTFDQPAIPGTAIPGAQIPRSLQFALFVTGLLWVMASRKAAEHAALGIGTQFHFSAIQPLLTEGFFLFLILAGFATLHWIAIRRLAPDQTGARATNALPKRPTSRNEWLLGAALGWGLLLAALVPMILAGDLHPQFWLAPRSWGLALISLGAIALGTLALEAAWRGYLFKRLIDATGPVIATIVLSMVYAILSGLRPNATGLSILVTFLAGLLFSLAYLRTHALWLGWGLHFAWVAAAGVLFGLPVAGSLDYSSLVSTDSHGLRWLTGGEYGPDGALLTGFVLIAGMVLLYRATRDYAWAYTHPPIVAGGYAVVVQPPAAHTAMEQTAAAAPAPLVQIAAITPASASTMPAIDEHLRRESEDRE